MLKFSAFEVTVPSVSDTGTMPAVAIRVAGMLTVMVVDVAVVRLKTVLLKTTCVPGSTTEVETVSAKVASPAVAKAGFSAVML